MSTVELNLTKMRIEQVAQDSDLQYFLGELNLNELLDTNITIEFSGSASCLNCQRKIKKTYNQGYCFPCFQKLAKCDLCIVKPERCHYAAGTCREPEWGEKNCLIPHTVYLANSAGLKIGITRRAQNLTRWRDQGAIEALEFAVVPERKISGFLEVELAKQLSDRTNWRKLITTDAEPIDLFGKLAALKTDLPAQYSQYLLPIEELKIVQNKFPILSYPDKARPFNLNKGSVFSGRLTGLKGQYLLTENSALNIRKYAGYQVKLTY